jgi:hypothetical protein
MYGYFFAMYEKKFMGGFRKGAQWSENKNSKIVSQK